MCHTSVCASVCVCVCFVTYQGGHSYGTRMHTHTERLQHHHKVLGGQGTVVGEAATACLNSCDTGLSYLRKG